MRSMQQADEGFLERLTGAARARIRGGYYAVGDGVPGERRSLVEALRAQGRIPVVAEVKFRSPSEGMISRRRDAAEIARAYERGGAAAVSVLTEPDNFDGRMEYLSAVKRAVGIPVLMKDVVVDSAQTEAASSAGADAVLLIAGVFDAVAGNGSLDEMVRSVHRKGLEAMVEVHDEGEYGLAMRSDADVVGINNRDLRTLTVSLETSRRLLRLGPAPKPVICESGISSRDDIGALKDLGADGFLVGTALMRAEDPEALLKRLTRVGPR